MNDEKKKEGLTIKEMENYTKKFRFEIFLCLLFIFASLFTLIFWGPEFSVFFAGIGALIGVLIPKRIDLIATRVITTVTSKDIVTQLIVFMVGLVVAIFLPPIIFFVLGVHGGKSMISTARNISPL